VGKENKFPLSTGGAAHHGKVCTERITVKKNGNVEDEGERCRKGGAKCLMVTVEPDATLGGPIFQWPKRTKQKPTPSI